MSLLIKNISEIYTMDKDFRKIQNGFIYIENNKIKNIGSDHTELNTDNTDHIISAEGKIALPGFVNCHTHTAMTLMRGFADDLPLQTWLEEKIWPLEANLSAKDVYWGTLLGILEMISSGVTTFCDMYFFMDQVAEAVKKSGMRAVLGIGLIEEQDGEKGLNEALEFALNHQSQSERISTVLSPHAPYTCSPAYLCDIIGLSKEYNIPLNIHVSETKKEYDYIKKKYNRTPVQHLENIGLWERPTTAAHCVHLDEKDIGILSKYEAGVSYNAQSNMKLGSGIAPITELIGEGVNVGLGTDGASSNNNLDMIEEARTASYLQKVKHEDPTKLNLEKTAQMLTGGGAMALHLQNLGILKKNYLADIILIDINKEFTDYPHHNNLSNLLYAGNRNKIDTVIINGNIVMDQGDFLFLEPDRILKEAEMRASNLLKK